jgi:DNA invertase Pin-like site-specific DNA recombinase
MNNNLNLFTQWSKTPKLNYKKTGGDKVCVVYTRVSSKEQFETNLSLDWQKKAIDEYAIRNDFKVAEYFGGTFESAKTDGRKEFQRMLEFIKKNKERVTHILVYLLDRFSRTGDGAMRLSKELREKCGVTIIAVTQPIDTSNPGGVFQQNMQFLFSEYDNQLRRQRAMAGIKEKLERGIWCKRPPMGYSVVREDRLRKIIVNDTGKKIRKAFLWKAEGMKNDEILRRLKALGIKLYKQKLSMIFSNPFYCGIIANKMLNGKLVEGTHEKMIDQAVFLKVNNVRAKAGGKYGVTHKKEIQETPLKLFARCEYCGNGLTSYVVRKKYKNGKEGRFYYYKCRSHGCNCNKNAKDMNKQFIEFLSLYALKPDLVAATVCNMNTILDRHYESAVEQQNALKLQLKEIDEKIDNLEENYYLEKKMPEETYSRLKGKLADEKKKIHESLATFNLDSSNLKRSYAFALELSIKSTAVWTSSGIATQESLQKLIFPDGITYDRKKDAFLTRRVNLAFAANPQLNSIPDDDPNKQGSISAALSSLVGKTERTQRF